MGNCIDISISVCEDFCKEENEETSSLRVEENNNKEDLNNPEDFIIWSYHNRESLTLYKSFNNRDYYTFDEIHKKYLLMGGVYQREPFRSVLKDKFINNDFIKYHFSTEKNGVFFEEGKYTKTGISFLKKSINDDFSKKLTNDDFHKKLTNDDSFDCVLEVETITNGAITTIFKDIKTYLLKYIVEADEIVGCVAWLKDEDICRALNLKNPKIVVNNDSININIKYDWIKKFNSSKHYMHNKFIIFRKYLSSGSIHNYAVFTGSFNFTKNASNNLENSLYINDHVVADKYYEVFLKIWANSEV